MNLRASALHDVGVLVDVFDHAVLDSCNLTVKADKSVVVLIGFSGGSQSGYLGQSCFQDVNGAVHRLAFQLVDVVCVCQYYTTNIGHGNTIVRTI